MVDHSSAEEVPSFFSSASDFVNSFVVPSQLGYYRTTCGKGCSICYAITK